jgi:hypothetical protein
VSDRLRIGVQFLARDLGTIGNNEVTLDWAIADYHWTDQASLMVGQMKFIMGLYNETRDLDMLRTFVFLPQSVYNEGWRDSSSSIQGASVYGGLPAGSLGSVNYDVQFGTLNIDNDKGAARLLQDQWPFDAIGLTVEADTIDVKHAYTGALKWVTGIDGLVFGASTFGYKFTADANTSLDTTNPYVAALFAGNLGAFDASITVPQSHFDVKATSYVGSMEYTWRNFVFAAEYMQTSYDISIANDLFSSTGVFHAAVEAAGADVNDAGTVTVPRFSSEGYYASLTYRFNPFFEMGTYYSVYYADKDDKDGYDRVNVKRLDAEDYRGWLKDYCLTGRFDLTENWILKLEGHKMNGAAILLGADNPPVTSGDRYEENWYLYAAKVTYSF